MTESCRCNPTESNGGSSTWCERCEKPKGIAALATSDPQAGQPARRFKRPDTRAAHSPDGPWELIGPADCPIMWRRTLYSSRWLKVLWHRFMPDASDADPHDHPRAFLTIVLRGGYDDIQPDGTTDEVRAPAIRYRPAKHAHITKVGPIGATTLCIMGMLRRDWGFWRDGKWYPWRAYERIFGLNWRCP